MNLILDQARQQQLTQRREKLDGIREANASAEQSKEPKYNQSQPRPDSLVMASDQNVDVQNLQPMTPVLGDPQGESQPSLVEDRNQNPNGDQMLQILSRSPVQDDIDVLRIRQNEGENSYVTASSVQSGDNNPEDNFLGDSDLESQMDDFKLQEDSNLDSSIDHNEQDQHESQTNPLKVKSSSLKPDLGTHDHSHDHGHGHSDSDDDSQSDDSFNQISSVPEELMLSQMEDYYNQNYKDYEVKLYPDFVKTRIFSVTYDQYQEIAYIFTGKIKQISGKKLVNCKIPKSRKQKIQVFAKKAENVPWLNCREFREIKQEMLLERARENEQEMEALQVYAECEVEFNLILQIWSLDDRIMLDQEHRKRPFVEILTLKTLHKFDKSMTNFCHMNWFQNQFRDYAEIVQQKELIIFFKEVTKLALFNTQTHKLNIFKNIKYNLTLNQALDQIKFFKFYLQLSDPKKYNTEKEYINCFSYCSQIKLCESQKQNDAQDDGKRKTTKIHQYRQYLQFRSISLNPIKQSIQQELPSPIDKSIKVKEQTINFRDENLLDYKINSQNRMLKSFFFQKILESGVSIILFPTGLLMQLGSQPLTIQSKIQLNLKKDETIIDFSYCISEDKLNQAIWFLDEKLQIWKCVNELNPNSTNWTLIKITMFDYLSYKQFIQPSMTYYDFYISSIFNKLHCFKKNMPCNTDDFEFIMKFNMSSTKLVFVIQAQIQSENKLQNEPPDYLIEENLDQCIERRLGFTACSWRKYHTRIILISKKQQIILNQIKEKKSFFHTVEDIVTNNFLFQKASRQVDKQKRINRQKVQSGFFKQLGISFRGQSSKQMPKQISLQQNDIMELIYLGKSNVNRGKGKSEIARLFLIRKKHWLELFYTNGLFFWLDKIDKSEVDNPFIITEVKVSADKKKIIMFYNIKGTLANNQLIRLFCQTCSKKYELYEDQFIKSIKTPRNIQLRNNKIIELKFNIASKSSLRSNFRQYIDVEVTNGQTMNISMPKQVFTKELLVQGNPLDKAMLSQNGRLILSGKIVIQLNKEQDEVENIGCFYFWKDNSFIHYNFLSLLQQDQRKEISRLMRTQQNVIVEFSNERAPITPIHNQCVLYAMNKYDLITGETSIIKIDTQSLLCHEIYQSKFNLVHMAIFEKARKKEKINKPSKISKNDLYRSTNFSFNRKPSLNQQHSNLSHHQETKRSTNILFSLVSQSKNHLNLEIISDMWSCQSSNDEYDDIELQPHQSNIKEGGEVIPLDQNQHSINQPNLELINIKSSIFPKVDHQYNHEGGEISMEQNLLKSQGQNKNMSQSLMIKEKQEQIRLSFAQRIRQMFQARFFDMGKKHKHSNHQSKAVLEYFIVVSVRNPIEMRSEVGWINANKFILTINDQFYLLNLKHNDLIRVKNDIKYGRQQLNMNVFCSITRKIQPIFDDEYDEQAYQNCDQDHYNEQTRNLGKHTQELIESQLCIQRMELATLRRFSQLVQVQQTKNKQMLSLIFFTPSEELHGSNIFSSLSNNYNIIQPYLEMIDKQFIDWMNQQVYNIAFIVRKSDLAYSHGIENLENQRFEQKNKMQSQKTLDNSELFGIKTREIHMYQPDISNYNAIDYAFQKNAIFCIKAFVDTLLILSDENQFQNCFDRALLLMIQRNLDVQDLINSQLFFAPLWTNYSLFAESPKLTICPVNCDIEDLQFEDPNILFQVVKTESVFDKICSKLSSCFYMSSSKYSSKGEMFEMQYNYIFIGKVCGDNKIAISRTLKESKNLELFEMEPIQHIIDYKWETYTYEFFLKKFQLYLIFLIFYYIDIERGLYSELFLIKNYKGLRIKDSLFFVNKGICILVQSLFTIYELIQIHQEGRDYFEDIWNYMEVAGIVIFYIGAALDILNPSISTTLRYIWCFSIMFSLIKIIYLVRVFKQLNFLVTMVITVVKEVRYFMVLFSVFLITFGECNHIIQVDSSAYGRTPGMLAHFFGVLRIAMGDQANVDPFETFDRTKVEPGTGKKTYIHSLGIVMFTFGIWVIQNFFLFMVFMNFIIAVIGESYAKVVEFKMAHDYHQRIQMIYERELHFNLKDFENNIFFPDILLIRQQKQSTVTNKSSLQKVVKLDTVLQVLNQISQLRNYIKTSQSKAQEGMASTMRELKMHLTNSIKSIEGDILNFNKEQERFGTQMRTLGETLRGSDKRLSNLLLPSENTIIKKKSVLILASDKDQDMDDQVSSSQKSSSSSCEDHNVEENKQLMQSSVNNFEQMQVSFQEQEKQFHQLNPDLILNVPSFSEEVQSNNQFQNSQVPQASNRQKDISDDQSLKQSKNLISNEQKSPPMDLSYQRRSRSQFRPQSKQQQKVAQSNCPHCQKKLPFAISNKNASNFASRAQNLSQEQNKQTQNQFNIINRELQAQKQQIQLILEMQKQTQLLVERNIIYNQRAVMSNQQQFQYHQQIQSQINQKNANQTNFLTQQNQQQQQIQYQEQKQSQQYVQQKSQQVQQIAKQENQQQQWQKYISPAQIQGSNKEFLDSNLQSSAASQRVQMPHSMSQPLDQHGEMIYNLDSIQSKINNFIPQVQQYDNSQGQRQINQQNSNAAQGQPVAQGQQPSLSLPNFNHQTNQIQQNLNQTQIQPAMPKAISQSFNVQRNQQQQPLSMRQQIQNQPQYSNVLRSKNNQNMNVPSNTRGRSEHVTNLSQQVQIFNDQFQQNGRMPNHSQFDLINGHEMTRQVNSKETKKQKRPWSSSSQARKHGSKYGGMLAASPTVINEMSSNQKQNYQM